MSWFGWLFGHEQRATLAEPTAELKEALGVRNTVAGIPVNEASALRHVAVLACIRVYAEAIASLPCHMYRRLERGKERTPDHPLYTLLHDRPNPEMTAFSFYETLESHALLWGNCYAEIDFGKSSDRPLALWPLLPDRTHPERDERTGKIVYKTTLDTGAQVTLPAWKVFHVPGLGFDGLVGYSPIRLAREAISLGMATEHYGAAFFGNGARPSGVLEHPGKLSDPAYDRLKASWDNRHGGLTNAQRLAILEEGMKYTAISVPPEDAQFLETRKFQLAEIARLYRVPLHMIGDLERATFSNIEHQSIEFVVHSLRPWLRRWEQAINWKLLGQKERRTHFAEFLVDGLLRGDIKSRYEAYAVGRQNGWLSADDIREAENMNPLPSGSGQIYLVPMNMVPADKVEAIAEAQIKKQSEPKAEPQAKPGAEGTGTPDAARAFDVKFFADDIADRIHRRAQADMDSGKWNEPRLEAFINTALRAYAAALGMESRELTSAVMKRFVGGIPAREQIAEAILGEA